MSKKACPRSKRTGTRHRGTAGRFAAVALLMALAASAATVSRWRLPAPLGFSTTHAPAQATPSPLPLAKEYVYAGGRLVATEGPTNLKSGCCVNKDGSRITSCRCFSEKLPKPQALTATPESSTQVAVAWASAGEGVRYEVERSTSIDGPFTAVSLDAATSITDQVAGTCVAYLYRVRTVDQYGDYSEFSNVDLATTCTFTQDPLIPRNTVVRAQHLEELRLAVEAVRATAILPRPTWTDPAPAGKQIKAVHVEELRSLLDEALGKLNLPPPPAYTDAPLRGVVIKAVHVQELRDRVK